jgi:hypothetical protein
MLMLMKCNAIKEAKHLGCYIGHVWKPSFKLKTNLNYMPRKFYTLIQKLLLG